MLKDKVVIITGASRGIGSETAKILAGYGAKVIVNYCGSKEKAESVVTQITANGGTAVVYKANVANAEEVEVMFADVMKEFGRVDVLVNNAGITRDNLILKMSEEEFTSVIDTNLGGVFHCCKQASKIMLKQKSGRIINISSVVGLIGNAGQANYCAAKAGIVGMTKALARELGSRGITVNAVAPGFIQTEMTDVLSDKVKEMVLSQVPLKKLGVTKDIAEAVAFLASENAAYITGQVLQVDGGMGM
ncbi:MAG: 3-oxoacyl-[acyl-carrier-protein] reductase [Clostridiales bacterium]|nr:3-oxoacyl-[acyl-carrier-protein] reductase [Clostridiales bacterium]